MAATAEHFRSFWANKDAPLSRSSSPEFYRLVSGEIKLLFADRAPLGVLEIGCGNGCLFDYLGFSARFYRGVDFGPRMLDAFRRRHPGVELVEADGSSYADDRKYDLILAHDVIAHFTFPMLERHCRNARSMMHAESLLIWSALPWRALRRTYDLGLWTGSGSPSVANWGKRKLRRLLGRETIGHWYSTPQIARIAHRNGLQARFHGSISHPYRFHAVMSPIT